MNTHPVDLDSLEAQTLAWSKYLKDVGEIIMELRLRKQSQIPVAPHGAQRYINELEKRLRMACEPCADCGHIDYRELDDVLDREGVTRYAALASSGSERAAERLAVEVQALVDRGVISSRSPAADALLDYRDGVIPQAGSEREQELTNALRVAREFIVGVDLHGNDPPTADAWRWRIIPPIDEALAPAVEDYECACGRRYTAQQIEDVERCFCGKAAPPAPAVEEQR